MEDQPPGPPQGPPTPPSSGYAGICPHCGQHFVAGAVHCSACGLRLALGSAPLDVAGMVVVGIVALVVGSMGTCSLLGGIPLLLSPRGDKAFVWPILLFGAGASYLAILCVRRILESVRVRREKP